MKRFLGVAVIVALAGAIVAVVVISSGDGQGPKQPSVEQEVSPADELPRGVRELLGRRLDRVRSVECGRRAVEINLPPSAAGGCVVGLRRAPPFIALKLRGKWLPIAITHNAHTRVLGRPLGAANLL